MAEPVGTYFVDIFRNVPPILQLFFWYAILLALPSPRDATLIFGSIALTGRGIYVPWLNVSGGSVFVAARCLIVAAAASLWLGFRRWPDLDLAHARRERHVVWGATLLLAVVAMWIIASGAMPRAPVSSDASAGITG